MDLVGAARPRKVHVERGIIPTATPAAAGIRKQLHAALSWHSGTVVALLSLSDGVTT
jgi:hypothetical protein